jgi:hypothetical protein
MVSVPPQAALKRSKNVDEEVLFPSKAANGANRVFLMSQQVDLCSRHCESCLTQALNLTIESVSRNHKFVDNNYISDLHGQD